jgi:hypothetical protein
MKKRILLVLVLSLSFAPSALAGLSGQDAGALESSKGLGQKQYLKDYDVVSLACGKQILVKKGESELSGQDAGKAESTKSAASAS